MAYAQRMSPEEVTYLQDLAEVNSTATIAKINELMSERFGRRFTHSALQERLVKLRGPRRIACDTEKEDEFFAMVAANSSLSFRELAEMFSELKGVKMTRAMARGWYRRVLNRAA